MLRWPHRSPKAGFYAKANWFFNLFLHARVFVESLMQIPALIYQIEMFELAVIRLDKRTKVQCLVRFFLLSRQTLSQADIARFLKRTVARDFRIEAAEVFPSLSPPCHMIV